MKFYFKKQNLIDNIASLKHDTRYFLREMKYLLWGNLDKVLIFIILYHLFGILAIQAIINYTVYFITIVSGQAYIGPDTIFEILCNPAVLMVLAISIFLLVCLSVFEMAALIHAYGMAKIGKKTTVMGMIVEGIHACTRIIKPKNWGIIPFILILIPLTGLFTITGVSILIEVPEFISDFIIANSLYKWLYRGLMMILTILELFLLYAISFFLMRDDKSFHTSCKDSIRLIQGNYLQTLFYLTLASIILSLATSGISGIISDVAIRAISFTKGNLGIITENTYTLTAIVLIKQLITGMFMPSVKLAALTVLFYQIMEEKNMLVKLSKRNFSDTKPEPFVTSVCCFCIAVLTFSSIKEKGELITHFNDPVTRPTIVAHRGDSVHAPENTMPAFELAYEEGVEWVEFDVHQTADGIVVVCHDEDLTRVSGKKVCVSELTYEDTRFLDVGSWFSKEFSYVRLSTLDEVLKLFKTSDTRLQIEVKGDGPTEHLVERALKVVYDNDMEDRVVFTSLEKSLLEEIKSLNQEIPTLYSMYIAYSSINEIEEADHFTIEQSNYTRELVLKLQESGSLCFAWTANTEDTIQYLVDCGVDGILTDNPVMIKNALDNAEYSGGIMRYCRLILRDLVNGFK